MTAVRMPGDRFYSGLRVFYAYVPGSRKTGLYELKTAIP